MKLNKDQFNILSNGITDIVDRQEKVWATLYWKDFSIGAGGRAINHFIGMYTTNNLDFVTISDLDREYPDKDIYMSINDTEFMYSSVEDRKLENKQTDATRRAYNKGFKDGMDNFRGGGGFI